ncbi:16S rRNA (uracil(1498)-N(3))-methyltransferase [Salegentibacter salegens]|uniref:Ribosomal RNA small subunit methyltransferase E n=1 Tax=Salegentibacter salegens TaxID=143223 RepID=A0A1M7J3N7_9FLAO|nr:16S rRNA (uracil(1498)-N(3))-methyltransferase [Salegentibacter salegens]PRX47368.1 16S rRNA (uracil1498-N3)-methyltransferase [Salegentibacter salegens]SHM47720.1 16S rRNA (uracil1498-N3)-methyltransferase [Salegentibacter salegens]
MQLFYTPNIEKTDKQIVFPKDESRHIAKVLRKSAGDTLKVTNGKGFLFTAEIITADPKQCLANIIEVEAERPKKYRLHLVVAPTKMNDRYEWFLEKATEIGIDEITPIICDHSERKTIKLNRYERVLQSAMKQSLHFSLPVINEAINFSEFAASGTDGQKFIAHCEDGMERFSLKNQAKPQENITILIGPEGDFSAEEVKLAIKNNWKPVSLGDSRLRTETAAIVACHTVALINQD